MGGITDFVGAGLGGVGDTLLQGVFNATEASKNRDFQERMARNQYQYAAQDLAKAGLNRVLALGSPTPTPSGAVAAPIDGPFGKAAQINSAKASAELLREQAQLAKDQQDNIKADTAQKNVITAGQIPALIESLKSQAAFQGASARVQSAEASKQEVIKAGYEAIAPLVKNLSEFVSRQLNPQPSSVQSGWNALKHWASPEGAAERRANNAATARKVFQSRNKGK